ncbi:MAG: amidohydrolase family protein [Deltaproteobacteria bacterium]|nr:amidohydrolase family protein [Deltaproteobacteria bacterium]
METDIIFYKARWVYPVESPPIENGVVTVSQGKIISVGDNRRVKDQGKLTDLGDGVIFPALINAHTHLELSALKGRLNPGLGFLSWVRGLLAIRESLTEVERLSAIQTAVKNLHRFGTIAVGDWTGSLGGNGFESPDGLVRCAFYEVIGFLDQTLTLPASLTSNSELRTPNSLRGVDPSGPEPELSPPDSAIRNPHSAINWARARTLYSERSVPDSAIRNPQSAINWLSLGAHAPHTTSSRAIQSAKTWTNEHCLPLSIHVAESIEEEEFLFTGQGPWREFLQERGRGIENWASPKKNPVAYLESLGVLDKKTQCIHLTRAVRNDLEILKDKRAQIVVCPRSNYFISRSLPLLPDMLQLNLAPALGTDSLASNQDLSLWEEMAFVHRSFPGIDPRLILEMATLNGARALNLEDHLGSLAPGKKAGMLFLPLEKCPAKEFPEAMIYSRGKDLLWLDVEPYPSLATRHSSH